MASRSWNRVELIGNLTRDPELRYTPNGAAVCTFGLATNRTYVTEGERKEEVDFHRLVSWNKLAELCNQLLKKGHKVFISGRLQTRSWEAQDGQTRTVTEIVIEDMILLTPKGGNGEHAIVGTSDLDEVPEPPSQAAVKSPAKPAEEEEEKKSRPKDDQPLAEKEPEAEKTKEKEKDEKSPQTPPQEEVKDDLPF